MHETKTEEEEADQLILFMTILWQEGYDSFVTIEARSCKRETNNVVAYYLAVAFCAHSMINSMKGLYCQAGVNDAKPKFVIQETVRSCFQCVKFFVFGLSYFVNYV